jgi:hypothetical protein
MPDKRHSQNLWHYECLTFAQMPDDSSIRSTLSALAHRYTEAQRTYSELRKIARETYREGRINECRRYVQDARLERERTWTEFHTYVAKRFND